MILSLTEEQKIDSLLENIVPISNSLFSAIQNIPIVYNESENYGLVKYNDLDNLHTQYYSDINNSINLIAESNGIDPNSIFICVNESDLIEFPEIVNELSDVNYVVDPIPMDNPTVQLCDYLVEEALETGDESCLDVLEEDYTVLNEIFDKLSSEEKKNLRKKLLDERHDSSRVARKEFENKYKPMIDKFASSASKKSAENVFRNFYYGQKKYETNGGKVTTKFLGPSRYRRFMAQNRKSAERTNLIKNAANINRLRKQPRISFIKDVSKQNQLIDIANKNKEAQQASKSNSTNNNNTKFKLIKSPNIKFQSKQFANNSFINKAKPINGSLLNNLSNQAKGYFGKSGKEKASQLAGQAKNMASKGAGLASKYAAKGVGLAGKFASQGKGLLGNLKPKNFSSKLKNGAIDAGILAGGALLYKNRNSIINRIKGLRAKSDQLEKRMQSAPAPQKGLFRRIIDKIKSIIQKLMNKLRGR